MSTLVAPLLACLILGDSLAVGTGAALGPQSLCETHAKIGINSKNFVSQYADHVGKPTGIVVISLGSNDGRPDAASLTRLREAVSADRVVWILPSQKFQAQRRLVQKIAEANGDSTIAPSPAQISADGVHPTGTGYRALAKKVGV